MSGAKERTSTTVKSKLIVLGLVAALWAGIIAPASMGRASAATPAAPAVTVTQTHPAFLDKTRFLLHVGEAYFAFHHWVYAPYKKGAFAHGAHGRTFSLIKAGIALAFAYHEMKVAYGIAEKSHSKLLHALVAPLDALAGKTNSLGALLHRGGYDEAGVQNLNGSVNSFGALASGNGYAIKDVPTPIPGL